MSCAPSAMAARLLSDSPLLQWKHSNGGVRSNSVRVCVRACLFYVALPAIARACVNTCAQTGSLTMLTNLQLYYNVALTGPIPTEWGKLTRMVRVQSMWVPGQIHTSIRGQLRTYPHPPLCVFPLATSVNNMNLCTTLPTELARMTQLTVFYAFVCRAMHMLPALGQTSVLQITSKLNCELLLLGCCSGCVCVVCRPRLLLPPL